MQFGNFPALLVEKDFMHRLPAISGPLRRNLGVPQESLKSLYMKEKMLLDAYVILSGNMQNVTKISLVSYIKSTF
jgi:hypothetical protein